ncbi:MAG: tRNA pseudouridine(38-40) synthase TruA [Steroidobacteraceae bacterium]
MSVRPDAVPARRRRIAIGVEYDGGSYSGWQSQPHARSIQATIEAALARVADAPVALICAGRTDAGVHARAQVAHFDSTALRSARAWLLGANTHLPADVSLRWAQVVPDHFHARYSALSRTYRYLILNRGARSALAAGRALVVHQQLELEPMRAGAAGLVGEHDFSAFRSVECQSRSPVRVLRALTVERTGDWVTIEVTANAFLHHMARNLVGALLAIGLRRAAPESARAQLDARVRDVRTATAAAAGLYLWRVQYPPPFALPADVAAGAAMTMSDSAIMEVPLPGWPQIS